MPPDVWNLIISYRNFDSDTSSSNQSQQHCNDCDHQQYVDDTANAEYECAKYPADYENDCNDI